VFCILPNVLCQKSDVTRSFENPWRGQSQYLFS
jgi:hypothetical protein